ncbi:MAG: hypothetical protein ACFFB3_05460 [Candidatus Hodarchaeota archaeon]
MNLQKTLPSAVVIVITLVCASAAMQLAELEGEAINTAGILAFILAGLLAGALFGENVYSGIKFLVILAELFVAFLIVILMLAFEETREEAQEASGAEAITGVLVVIILIVLIIALLALGIVLVILALITAIGGWIGVKIHTRFVGQPSSVGHSRQPSRRSR